ncbi:MAG: exo-alpha-sialidase, partial [Planctomycetes bacterium]|nr:exo-alpha-sialidase [Planctomycetota bacterium]
MKHTLTLLTALLLAPVAVMVAAIASAANAPSKAKPERSNHPAVTLAREVAGANHVVVNKPNPGRAFGWPANGGIWSWGNEILVMYLDCPYKDCPGFSNHDSDQSHPSSTWMTSRSTDGGVTWTEHRAAFASIAANRATLNLVSLKTPIDFRDPATIVSFHWDSLKPGARTYLYYSTDRGRTWKGPFDNIPLFDFKAMTGRTDYEVTGQQSLTAYMSCTEVSDAACIRESSYAILTDNGGVTW